MPDPSQFPSDQEPVQPYIFPAQEVARLVRATADLKPNYRSPLRREVFRLAIVLLYTTGLRHGELRRLTVGDYDSREHTLLVRASKFHKSRLLPLSPDGVRELNAYLVARQAQGLSLAAEAPLLWNRAQGGRPYTAVGLGAGVRLLLKATGINTPSGRRPRIHDFRHTFAVHALVRWYREGVDVQAKLPYLATYLGHVSIVSTQYYLHFVEELSQCASDRFAQHCGSLVTLPSEVQGGVR
jgi:integrase